VSLQRVEDDYTVIYIRNGEIIGVIRYNQNAPSDAAIGALAKRIVALYRRSVQVNILPRKFMIVLEAQKSLTPTNQS